MRGRRARAPIKAVFFDIGNVLVRHRIARFFRHIAEETGFPSGSVAGYFWIENISERLDRGEITPRRLFERLRAKFGYRGAWPTFAEQWCGHLTPRPGAERLLRDVSRRHRVYLLSNTNALHYGRLRRRRVFERCVDGAVLSYRLGIRKPEPEIFRIALRRARIEAGEAVFIDDSEANVAAARRLGIAGVLYSGARDARKRLRKAGVSVVRRKTTRRT